MVMNEKISRLMDGEIDATDMDVVFRALKSDSAMTTWNCYHVIGDALRGETAATRSIAGPVGQRLASEPAIVAAPARTVSRPESWALAAVATLAAVTVVGWTAYSMVDATPAGFAKMREASTISAAGMRPAASLPADYLLAHQEYAPANALQGVGPYLRDVAASTPVRAAVGE
jgi:sigma-E factor negative regulatory protein RseA